MNINEIPDKVLADMVRKGCYSRNTNFAPDTHLLMLAIPYDSSDDVHSLAEAIEAFQTFVTDYDSEERNFQVLKVENGKPVTFETALENLTDN